MLKLTSLVITDAPEVWERLGFSVVDRRVRIGEVELQLVGTPTDPLLPRGIVGWEFATDGDRPLPLSIDGIAVAGEPTTGAEPTNTDPHANLVCNIDHLVVSTPQIDRTISAFEQAGLECRRQRERTYGSGDQTTTMRQAFFWLGGAAATPDDRVLCEVVGPKIVDEAKAGDPASFFGLAFTSHDLDATVATIGEHQMKPAIVAVQSGRRIATIRSSAGSTVPIAIMSPHVNPTDATAQ